MITAGLGRYGPFVLHDGTYANLSDIEEVFSVGLNRAVSVLAEKVAKGGRRGAAQTLKELGRPPRWWPHNRKRWPLWPLCQPCENQCHPPQGH